ncbi:MAG: carboxymuconolactone decarboxylase family protein [Myxococcaceae bacterium]
METLEQLKESLPDIARDIKLNLGNVLTAGTLSTTQVWGTAVSTAHAARNARLVRVITQEARNAGVEAGNLEDAQAAAVLMGMNNVFYRFRHVIQKESYTQRPARLRMMRIAQVAASKVDFELYCLAVSAINGCEACVRSHEAAVLEGGLSEDHVQDAVRIASVIHAAAVALEVAEFGAQASLPT